MTGYLPSKSIPAGDENLESRTAALARDIGFTNHEAMLWSDRSH